MRYYPVETKVDCTKILIKATIWGTAEIIDEWFLFDTGSDVVAAPGEILKKIGAEKIRDVSIIGATGELAGELYRANIKCGEVTVEGLEVYSSKNDYLLGMNFILRGRVGFFFNGQQLVWVTE